MLRAGFLLEDEVPPKFKLQHSWMFQQDNDPTNTSNLGGAGHNHVENFWTMLKVRCVLVNHTV